MDQDSGFDVKDKISTQKKKAEGAETDLLVSSIQKNKSSSSKQKGKLSDRGHNDEENEVGEANDHDVEVSSATCQYALRVT